MYTKCEDHGNTNGVAVTFSLCWIYISIRWGHHIFKTLSIHLGLFPMPPTSSAWFQLWLPYLDVIPLWEKWQMCIQHKSSKLSCFNGYILSWLVWNSNYMVIFCLCDRIPIDISDSMCIFQQISSNTTLVDSWISVGSSVCSPEHIWYQGC